MTETFPLRQRHLVTLFSAYYIIWIVANWPALHQAWWSSDDYTMMLQYDFRHNLYLGRPLEGLHQWFLPLEQSVWGGVLNIFFRYWQGALHCFTALLAISLLYRYTGRRLLFVTGLLFVIWPFNGEAVLWRASALPLAAVLAASGLVLLLAGVERKAWWRALLGMLLIAGGTLAHQLTAMIAALIWFYVALLRLSQPPYLAARTLRTLGVEALGVGVAYVSGIATALFLIRQSTQSFFRATPPLDWAGKFTYWQELLQKFFFIEYFPPRAQLLHLCLLALIVSALLYALFVRPKQGIFFFVGLALLLVLPYAPMLLVEENPTSPRMQYLAPFLLIVGLLLADITWQHWRWTGWILAAITTATLIIYIPIAQWNVVDFVNIYNADRLALQQLEAEVLSINDQTAPLVTVATRPAYVRGWNLHDVYSPWGDAKLSVYLVEWAVNPFVAHFSSLQPVTDPEINAQCAALCNATADGQPFLVTPLPDSTICCICP